MHTLGSMKAEVERWMREAVADLIKADAINDSIEALWEKVILVHIGMFMQGPVNISFANASERAQLVSIPDPTSAPTGSTVASGALGGRTYSITYTLVTESGSETLESPELSQVVPANDVAVVDSPAFVEGAIGWNCYAGLTSGRRALQNQEPLTFGINFQEDDTGFLDEPERPSPPTVNNTADDVFYIRHLELQHPDGTFRAWNQVDIDSTLMRQASAILSGTSTFQNYYFDFINHRTLEVRPATGAAHTPRHFYIQKPRRLRFDRATIPFTAIPHVAFIRYNSLSLIHGSLQEFAAANYWEGKAQGELQSIVLALNQSNFPRHQYVTPFMHA